MRDSDLEHPAITRTLRTGYPHPVEDTGCPECGGDMYKFYEIENEAVCVDCFRAWLMDYAFTNPDEVAEQMNVRHGRRTL